MKLNKLIGKFMNTIEHAVPFPFDRIVYWFLSNVLWKLSVDFYSDECYLCRGKIWKCLEASEEVLQIVIE